MRNLTVGLLVACALLNGCGKKEGGEAHGATQVVAKVNGQEITVHQLNARLAQMGAMDQAQLKEASKQVLRQLVDQQILKQEALDKKLDRDPKVLQALEQAKDQILAEAILEKIAGSPSNPTSTQVAEFYQSHPELFSNRKLFKLQELVILAPTEVFSTVESEVRAAKGLNEVSKLLTEKGIKFDINESVKASEQLPEGLLKQLQALSEGDTLIVKTPQAVNVVYVAQLKQQPVTQEKAAPLITRYLANIERTNHAKAEVQKLKSGAKVEFLGDFSDMKMIDKPQVSSSVNAAEAKPAKTETAETAKSDAPVSGDSKHDAMISKGLSGL